MSQPITIMEELSGDLAEMLATRTGMDEERVIKMHAAFLGVWTNIYSLTKKFYLFLYIFRQVSERRDDQRRVYCICP